MGEHNRSDSYIPVSSASAGSEQPEAVVKNDDADINFRIGAGVIAVLFLGGAALLINTFGWIWAAVAAAGGGTALWGAYRAKTGVADARHRRRMGIRRPPRRPRSAAAKAVRAHGLAKLRGTPTSARGRSGKIPGQRQGARGNGKPSGVGSAGKARWPKVPAPKAGKGVLSGPLPRPSGRIRSAVRQRLRDRLDRVAETRSGKPSRASRKVGDAANHLAAGSIPPALFALIAALLHGLRWLLVGPAADEQPDTPRPAVEFTKRVEEKPVAQSAQEPVKTEPEKAADAASVPAVEQAQEPMKRLPRKGAEFDDDTDSDHREPAVGKTELSKLTYALHPVQETLVRLHAQMFSSIAFSVPNMMDHLFGLSLMYREWSMGNAAFAYFHADQRPINPVIADLAQTISLQHDQNADMALQTLLAYKQSNHDDVERNLRPGVNEEWNNILAAPRGVDMTEIRNAVHAAGLEMYNYKPDGPIDMTALLGGMVATYLELCSHVEMAYQNGGFPGAGHDIASYWAAISNGYDRIAIQAQVVAETYEDVAAGVLRRHRDPRPNEAEANYDPVKSGTVYHG